MAPIRVFISYSHDSPAHAERVAGLAASLRRDGVDCWIDQYCKGRPSEGWPLWMEKEIENAEIVLVVCTETYYRRVRREEVKGRGRGVIWEANLIYIHLYLGDIFSAKFIPVVFDVGDEEFIPTPLLAAGYFVVDGQQGYDELYLTITGQFRPPPRIGSRRVISQRRFAPSFRRPGGTGKGRVKLKGTDLMVPGWEPPYPDKPYPLLRPYTHPSLFAGRERELAELTALLGKPIRIIGFFSPSGAGKSSLLEAGLVGLLRRKGCPVAYLRDASDPLVTRLLEGLLNKSPLVERPDEPELFAEYLQEVRRLSGKDPVLIIDQFEEVIDSDSGRDRIGPLLAASVQRSLCRWLLSYRNEYHGRVVSWLKDVLGVARRRDPDRLRKLPYDLSDQFEPYPLQPFASVPPGSESTDESKAAFLSAILKPLKVRIRGTRKPRYPIRFPAGDAERLAEAFVQARIEQPEAPLVPELQVVLAHLLGEAEEIDGLRTPCVPERPEEAIRGALRRHLNRSLEEAYPEKDNEGRATAWLALRELATSEGRRNRGRPARELVQILGRGGKAVLKTLASDKVRLIYATSKEEATHYALSHDLLASLVVRTVDQDPTDSRLLKLRRYIESASQFFLAGGSEQATSLSLDLFVQIQKYEKVLIRDKDRRAWWRACVAERNSRRADELKRDFPTAEPGPALQVLAELTDLGVSQSELADLLGTRSDLLTLFEQGAGELPEESSNAVVAAAGTAFTGLLRRRLERDFASGLAELGALFSVVDFGPLRDLDGGVASKAQRLRRSLVEALREFRTDLPALCDDDWAFYQGGTYKMGSDSEHEQKVHRVKVSPFRLLKHQVTSEEYAMLDSDRESPTASDPRLPAVKVTWHQAYAFAAWLGGRLPTEAEWEYAARSGGKARQYPWGDQAEDICERAAVSECGTSTPVPVGSLPKGNTEQGASDMSGNVWEWVSDWYESYSDEQQTDPWGPRRFVGYRVLRGGAFDAPADRARATFRYWRLPATGGTNIGFRVLIPESASSPAEKRGEIP